MNALLVSACMRRNIVGEINVVFILVLDSVIYVTFYRCLDASFDAYAIGNIFILYM